MFGHFPKFVLCNINSKIKNMSSTNINNYDDSCSVARLVPEATSILNASADAAKITYQIGAPAVFLFTGRLNVKVAPIASGLFSAHILPP